MKRKLTKTFANIDLAEKRLVEKLKLVCDKNGKEINQAESSPILHQLGKIYYEKGKPGSDMICFIQSAALYNAALARSSENKAEIKTDLKQLCREILDSGSANIKDADLLEQSIRAKQQIKEMRDYVSDQLKEIQPIPNNLSNQDLENYEQHKTNTVRNLQNEITKRYAKIMSDLASYCQEVMGDSPCNFAIIGMGSLARKEITPYSDFEHIIALTNEVLDKFNKDQMEDVLDYFRWFSVIFQTVLINLQESILPSVAIPCLNDFYSETKENNWFFDRITPSGISFDGMMPHACKFPLGRYKHTKKKEFKTELIKPVTQMLDYLKDEERLKNGYHLDDILTKTCYVYGDHAIYEKFDKGVGEVMKNLKREEREENVKKQIIEDLESFATRSTLFNMYLNKAINIKRVAYRSTTLFIAAYGLIFNIREPSCFDIIEKLAEANEFSEYAKQKLLYAIALACEIRLKWYMKKEKQSDIVDSVANKQSAIEVFSNIVGKVSTSHYFQIAYALQCDISERLHLKKSHFHSNPQLLNLSIQVCFDDPRKTKTLSNETIRKSKFDRLSNFDECLKQLEADPLLNQSAEALVETDGASDHSALSKHFNKIGDILYSLDCFDDAAEYYQKSLENVFVENNYSASTSDVECLKWSNIKHFDKQTIAYIGTNLNNTGQSLLKSNQFELSLRYFTQALQIKEQATTNPKTDKSLATTVHELGRCLLEMRRPAEAIKYYKRSFRIQEQATLDASVDTGLAWTLHELGRSLLELNRPGRALGYYKRAIQIKEAATLDAESDRSLAITLHEIGRSLLVMNRPQQALKYFKRALLIKTQETLDFDTDTSIATTLHELGRCCFEMNRQTEALKYFKRVVEIEERTSMDVSIDTNLAGSLYQVAKTFLKMSNANKALEYFKRSLEIKQAALESGIGVSIADNVYEVARCLSKMNKASEALKYYKQALGIDESSSTNPESDIYLAYTINGLGRCLMEMKRVTEAVEYFKRSLQIIEKTFSDTWNDPTSLVSSLHELGRCLLENNHATEALGFYKQALRVSEDTQMDSDTEKSSGISLHGIGVCFLEMNNAQESNEYFKRALEIKEKTIMDASTHMSFARSLHELGRCSMKLNKPLEALEYHKRALQIKQKATNANKSASLAKTLHELGRCLLKINKTAEALVHFKQALEIKEQAESNKNAQCSLAKTLHELGRCLEGMNQEKEALDCFKRALQIKNKEAQKTNTNTSLDSTSNHISRCLMKLGMQLDEMI